MFNDVLPIKFKVLDKMMFNRYKLLIGKKELTTKSSIELEPNTYYLAEIYDKLVFKNLQADKVFAYIDYDCFELLKIAFRDDFKYTLINSLLQTNKKADYDCYKTMLFALNEDILYLPCLLENKPILIEYRKKRNELAIYYDVFAKLSLNLNTNKIITSFSKVKEICLNYSNNVEISPYKDDFFSLSFKGKL